VYVITTTPEERPVTIPPVLTVAIAVELLLHAPPGVASVSDIEDPTHTLDAPMIKAGAGFTVILNVTKQPPIEYVIVTAPIAEPVTSPVEPTDATNGLLLLHDPPGVASESIVVDPAQTVLLPVIAAGAVMTETVFVTEQLPTV